MNCAHKTINYFSWSRCDTSIICECCKSTQVFSSLVCLSFGFRCPASWVTADLSLQVSEFVIDFQKWLKPILTRRRRVNVFFFYSLNLMRLYINLRNRSKVHFIISRLLNFSRVEISTPMSCCVAGQDNHSTLQLEEMNNVYILSLIFLYFILLSFVASNCKRLEPLRRGVFFL